MNSDKKTALAMGLLLLAVTVMWATRESQFEQQMARARVDAFAQGVTYGMAAAR